MNLTDLKVHILSPVKVFHQSQAMCLLVTPGARETRTVAKRVDGVLPIPVCRVVVALKHVATGEPQDRLAGQYTYHRQKKGHIKGSKWSHRMQLGKSLGNVDAQAILAVLVRRREQADEVEVKRALSSPLGIKRDGKSVVAARRIHVGGKLEFVLNPLVRDRVRLYLHGAEDLPIDVRLQRSDEDAIVSTIHPEGSRVLLDADVHTPVSIVQEADGARGVARRHVDGDGQGIREGRFEFLKLEFRIVDRVPSRQRQGESLAVLEGSVADELGVDATFSGVVDVLFVVKRLLAPGKVYRLSARAGLGALLCSTHLMKESVLMAAGCVATLRRDVDVEGRSSGRRSCECGRHEGLLDESHGDVLSSRTDVDF